MSTFTLTAMRGMLERSHLGRALVVYVSASWGVLQGVDLFTQHLGLPDWVFPGAVILLLIGLPLIVATALVQGRERVPAGPVEEGTGAAGKAAGRAAMPRRRAWLTWRRTLGAGAVAMAGWVVLVGAYMGARQLGVGPMGTLLAKGAVNARDKILVADFDDHTDQKDLGQTVAQALALDLSQSRVVRVMTRADAAAALRRMEKDPNLPLTGELAREVAQREGIKAVLEGSVSAIGPATVISVRLATPQDSVLADFGRTAGGPDEVVGAVDHLAREIRDRVGESLKVIRGDPPLAQVTTASLPALRLFVAGMGAEGALQHTRAVNLLEQALRIDSTFAAAWEALANVRGNMAQGGPSADAMERAYRYRDRLTEVEREDLLIGYNLFVLRDDRAGAAIMEARLARDPGNLDLIGGLGFAYMDVGELALAEKYFRRLLARPDANWSLYWDLIGCELGLGRLNGADSLYQVAAARLPAYQSLAIGIGIPAARGDYDEAERRAQAWLRSLPESDPENRVMAVRQVGTLAGIRGQWRAAEGYYRDAAQAYADRDQTPSAFVAELYAAQFRYGEGHPREMAAALRTIQGRYPFAAMDRLARPYLDLAEAYARIGDYAEARSLMKQADADRVYFANRSDLGDRDVVLGTIALAAGDAPEAIERLRAAARAGASAGITGLADLGRAYEAAGQPDSAFAAYERFARGPSMMRAGEVNLPLGFVYERLSQLYEQRGNRERAAAYAAKFIALWKDADPELQPRVARARALLRRLNG